MEFIFKCLREHMQMRCPFAPSDKTEMLWKEQLNKVFGSVV